MKKILSLFLTCFISTVYGQNSAVIDSLEHELKLSRELKERTNLYIALADQYKSGNNELTQVYADSAIILAKSLNYTQAHVDALRLKGFANRISGNLEKAISHYNEMIGLSQEIDYKKGIAQAKSGKGIIYFIKGDFRQSLEENEAAVKIGKEIDDPEVLVEAYNNLSNTCYGLGDHKKSLFFRQLVIQLYKEAENKRELAVAYMNLGVFHYYRKDYDKALINYKKAASIHDETMDSEKAVTLNNIALVFENKDQLDSALFYYKQSKLIGERLNYNRLLGWTYTGLGVVNQKQGKLQEAKMLLDKALATRETLGDNFEISKTYIALGDNYKLENNIQQAIFYYQKAVNKSKANESVFYLEDALQKLHEIYREKGDFINAYKYHEEYHLIKDSLQNKENIEKITLLEAEFNFQKERDSLNAQNKIKDIALENSQIKASNNRNINILLSTLLLVSLCFIVIVFREQKIKGKLNKQLSKQSQELEELNRKKNKLFALVSHDLKSPMNRLFGLVYLLKNNLLEGKEKEEMLNALDKNAIGVNTLLTNLLSWVSFEEGNLSLKAEEINLSQRIQSIIEWIKPAASLKNIIISKELTENCHVKMDANSFDLIFRNLLSNAIKFVDKNGKVKIRGKKLDQHIELEIQDDGVGMPMEKINKIFSNSNHKSSLGTMGEKGTGLGLNLVREHVKMNGGNIRVESKIDEGTSFFITLKIFKPIPSEKDNVLY